jgi:hydroxymethylbilane synthase
MNTHRKIRIGTRGSPLAMAQAHEMRDRLIAAHPALAEEGRLEIVEVKTTGDRILDRPLSEIGGKALFTKELDDAMLRGDIDIAVHSMKDVETNLLDGIVLPAMLPREDVRDAFLCLNASSIATLKQGAVVGTSSLRRGAQIKARRPDIQVVNFRGNVQRRLEKLHAGEVDATMLAMAGLNRLGMAEKATAALEPDEMLPAVGQGAIGLTCRAEDAEAIALAESLNHLPTYTCVIAERAFLRRLDGSCRTPIGGWCRFTGPDTIRFDGLVVRHDGTGLLETSREGAAADARALADDAGQELRSQCGPDYFIMSTSTE